MDIDYTDRYIKETFILCLSGKGIFSNISNPIWASDFDGANLDILFYTKYGYRVITPFAKYYDNETNGITEEKMILLANLIYSVHKPQWEHLYKILSEEYSPVENANLTETSTDTTSEIVTSISDGTNNRTTNGTVSGNTTATDNASSKIFGFDSSSGSDDSSSIATSNETNSATSNGTDNDTTHNKNDETRSNTITHNYNRHGSIGVVTPAQMINIEIETWKWAFIDSVFEDVINMIALRVY